jgi:uncharacterized protein (DUF1919 family)
MVKKIEISVLESFAHVLKNHAELAYPVMRMCEKELFALELQSKFGGANHCFISQNCIGGLFYELTGRKYTSPTVGLWFDSSGFLEFCEKLDDMVTMDVSFDPITSTACGYPVGFLGGVRVHFQHYQGFDDARQAWTERARRVDLDKVVILMTDRDGFSELNLARFLNINKYPKLLFTNKRRLDHPSIVYIDGFDGESCVGNLYDRYDRFYENSARRKIFEALATVSW